MYLHAISKRRKVFLRQTQRIMRLTIFLLITGLVHSYAAVYSQDARFTINEKNVTLKKVLKEIETSSEYSFFYRSDQIDLLKKVNISVRDGHLDAVLKQALLGQSLSYDVFDKVVVIKPLNGSRSAAIIPIKGVVTDSVSHSPLAGVSIQVKGSKGGTVTNEKG